MDTAIKTVVYITNQERKFNTMEENMETKADELAKK